MIPMNRNATAGRTRVPTAFIGCAVALAAIALSGCAPVRHPAWGANGAPTANAGTDQTIDATAPSMSVTLNGSSSSDPNGDELVYTWTEGGSEIADEVMQMWKKTWPKTGEEAE